MLMPVNGMYECKDKCDFETSDLFEFLDHCGVEFGWGVRLNDRFSFDLFQFLQILNDFTNQGNLDGLYDHIQSATLMMVNASDDELDEFIEESVVAAEMGEIISGIEGLLKENNK